MKQGKVIPFPGEQPDVTTMMLDGKPETMLSARGVVLLALAGWKEDGLEASESAMRRYCEYISLHGYQGGAEKAFTELEGMDKPQGVAWVKRTFTRYVQDQSALAHYILDQA